MLPNTIILNIDMRLFFVVFSFAVAAFSLQGCATNTEAIELADDNVLPAPALPAGAYASREENPYFQQYPKAIDDCGQLMRYPSGGAMMRVFQQRYRQDLLRLKDSIQATGAQMVVLILTPTSAAGTTVADKAGIDFIAQETRNAGLPLVNMHSYLQRFSPQKITQYPKDGHWNSAGAALVATEMARSLQPYLQMRNGVVTYTRRPATLNDLEPGIDEVRDGGKDLPYHLVSNAQGIRASAPIAYPRKKPRVLLLGDSELFCPFLDDEHTIGVKLQQASPQAEWINASNIGYTLEDYASLFAEKAKYAEADVVVVATHPEDLINYFFVQRNRLGRSQKGYAPTDLEKKVYKELFGL